MFSQFQLVYSDSRFTNRMQTHEAIYSYSLISLVLDAAGGVTVQGRFSWHYSVPLVPHEYSLNTTAYTIIVTNLTLKKQNHVFACFALVGIKTMTIWSQDAKEDVQGCFVATNWMQYASHMESTSML